MNVIQREEELYSMERTKHFGKKYRTDAKKWVKKESREKKDKWGNKLRRERGRRGFNLLGGLEIKALS